VAVVVVAVRCLMLLTPQVQVDRVVAVLVLVIRERQTPVAVVVAGQEVVD
jgi:hypothetical protein